MDGMERALQEAEQALREGEIPVGAALYRGETLIWADHNRTEQRKDPTAHAEILALTALSSLFGDWRLDGVTLYVTKEPCAMCAGALVNARIERVVYGFSDPRCGCCGSALDITGFPGMLHQVKVTGGVLELECAEQFKEFFRKVRN